MKRKYYPLTCTKCGRFLGHDGYPQMVETDAGLYEGNPLCGKCGRELGYEDLRREGKKEVRDDPR